MALRHLARNSCSQLLGARSWSASAPTVFDKMVQVTVTDLLGHRHVFRGIEGDLLVNILYQHQEEIGGDAVLGLSSEGRGVLEAHVTVANEFTDKIPAPKEDDIIALQQLAPVHTVNSRLASKITMTKELNNLSVALGKIYPWRTL